MIFTGEEPSADVSTNEKRSMGGVADASTNHRRPIRGDCSNCDWQRFFSISFSIIRHSKVELFNKLLLNLEDQLKRDISKLGIIC